MKIVFMGTPDFAVACLQAMVEAPQCQIVAVVTQPDRPKGRGHRILMSAVKEYALQHELPVWQPIKVKNPDFQQKLAEAAPDLIVVAAFGQFLPKAILTLPKYGCINVHASLLPKYRGAAPLQYAILKGESVSGVTIMKMDIGMDTGDMLAKVEEPITAEMTMGELHDKLKIKGAKLLLETISGLEAGTVIAERQKEEEATYASLLTREMEKLDWKKAAQELHNQVRAFNPWPSSFTVLPDGKLLKVWECKVVADTRPQQQPGTIVEVNRQGLVVATGLGLLELTVVQPESKKRMSAAVFCNGHGLKVGDILGNEAK